MLKFLVQFITKEEEGEQEQNEEGEKGEEKAKEEKKMKRIPNKRSGRRISTAREEEGKENQ